MIDYSEIIKTKWAQNDITYHAKRIANAYNLIMEVDDIEQELRIHLFKTLPNYDASKGVQLSTYFGTVLKNKAISIFKDSHYRNELKHRMIISNQQYWDTVPILYDNFEERIITDDFLDKVEMRLQNRKQLTAKKVIGMLRIGYTRSECAKAMCVSRSYISKILRNVKEQIAYV